MKQPTFDRYAVIRQLGEGGMGQVYLARERSGLDRLVVIKAIRDEALAAPAALDRFLQEARITARLVHPNIVEIHDMGEKDGRPYLVMEYVHGPSLADVLDSGRLMPIPVALEVAVALCRALHFAHTYVDEQGRSHRVVHRDLKPQNVLITFGGRVKIIDFGIAKSDLSLVRTASNMLQGSALYMSPEQARTQPMDHRSDIFSLGVMLYEMLSGVRLFERESLLATLNAIVKDEAPPPPREGVDEELSEVVQRALRKDPEERYSSALEMQLALEHCLEAQRQRSSRAEDDLQSYLRALFPDQKLTLPTDDRPVESPRVRTDPALAPTSASDQLLAPAAGLSVVDDDRPRSRPKPTRRWVLPLVGGGVAVAAAALGLWLGLSRPSSAPAPLDAAVAVALAVRPDVGPAADASMVAAAPRDARAAPAPDAAAPRPGARKRRRRPPTAKKTTQPTPRPEPPKPAEIPVLGVLRIRSVPAAAVDLGGTFGGRGSASLALRQRSGVVRLRSVYDIRLGFRVGAGRLAVTADSQPWCIAYPSGGTPKRVPLDLTLDSRTQRVDFRRPGSDREMSVWLSFAPAATTSP